MKKVAVLTASLGIMVFGIAEGAKAVKYMDSQDIYGKAFSAGGTISLVLDMPRSVEVSYGNAKLGKIPVNGYSIDSDQDQVAVAKFFPETSWGIGSSWAPAYTTLDFKHLSSEWVKHSPLEFTSNYNDEVWTNGFYKQSSVVTFDQINVTSRVEKKPVLRPEILFLLGSGLAGCYLLNKKR